MIKRNLINAALAPFLVIVVLGSITFAVTLALYDRIKNKFQKLIN